MTEVQIIGRMGAMNPGPVFFICDDYGYHASIDRAVAELASVGRIHGASVMVTHATPDFGPKITSNFSLGLHLNLTEGARLGKRTASTLTDSSGRFWGLKPFSRKMILGQVRHLDLYEEIEAQVSAFLERFDRLDHVDGHQHVQYFPRVCRVLNSVLEAKGLSKTRIRFGYFEDKRRNARTLFLKSLHRISASSVFDKNHFPVLVDYDQIGKVQIDPNVQTEVMLHVAHPDVPAPEFDMTSYSYEDRCNQFIEMRNGVQVR